LIAAVDRHHVDPSAIVLEITETVLVDEGDRATETIKRLREEGFRFAVDDYGAGYCSLSHLQRHPVDLLKIDRASIEEFGNDPLGNTLTRTILQMADSLELLTVAEGIETSNQLRELRRFGCDLGQGYLLSKPLEADDLAQRFRQIDSVGVI
jgi:EAL domain-containing protein (putative c-di-GMP-specific phosphodiesterase class I)